MRHAVLLGGVFGVAAIAPLVACLWPAAAGAPADEAAALSRAAEADSGRARVVQYRGVRVPVPAGWTVHRLDRDPSRCVRYDRQAVYLGRPGPQPDCPARLVGRTEAVHVAPLGGGRASRTVVKGDKLASVTVRPTTGHETRLTLPEAGVSITGVYGTDPARLQRILRGARLTSAWPEEPGRPGQPASPDRRPTRRGAGPGPTDEPTDGPSLNLPSLIGPPVDTPDAPDGVEETEGAWVSGKGFDTCTAPALASMRAWRPSFKVTNIYIGGAARGCAQPNLTRGWVREVRQMGYRITPTYVGLQAPCGHRRQRFTARNAASEGGKAAVDAARRAARLGIPRYRPIYFDMEAYGGKNASCRKAVLRFVDAWVRGLREQEYKPCLYSSAQSGIRDVGRADGYSKPGCIWFANWDGRARVYGDPHLPDDWWPPHRRIKQYRGGHKERHGGVTLNIDSNIADGSVY
ncbi:glycoside hydrolase domain-containing protein [Actinomadura macra]|uniref:glycoside hydrolase domain-containing protein n=1 Tax=Actinomadura macra TaxID=46164 RepID=UPI000AE72F08|nr:glycoside hydrolase domain-containing protein [Actinomadura macra]